MYVYSVIKLKCQNQEQILSEALKKISGLLKVMSLKARGCF